MLDAVTGIGIRMSFLCGFDGVQHHVDGRRRLSVRCSLQTDRMSLGDQIRVVRGLVIKLPGAARVAHVTVGEVRGPAAECAVGIELDATECQA